MSQLSHLLRDEHRELWPHVEQLRAAADAVGRLTEELGALRSALAGATLDADQAKALRPALAI